MHGGLSMGGGWREPRPEFTLLVGPSRCLLSPSRCARGRGPAERARLARKWPKAIRQFQAVRLIAAGHVSRALIHRSEGVALLSELRRCGVVIVTESNDGLVRRLRFRVPDTERSKRAAKRGRGRDA